MRLLWTKGDGAKVSALGVVRVEAKAACAAALIDAEANKNANDLARAAADDAARQFKCGFDKPALKGAAGDIVREACELLR